MSQIHLEASHTALVLIDLQNGILAMKTAPYGTFEVTEKCAALAQKFRAVKATVVYVRVDLANFRSLTVDTPSRDPAAPPPPASASELAAQAGALEGDLRITKRHWSAFPGTDLEKELKARGVTTIVIGGVATNFGVESTARDATGLGFDVVFAEDAMTSVSAEAHQFATSLIFPRLGRVRKAADIAIRVPARNG